VSEDPLGLAAGQNLQGYVGGNPVSFVDPEGKNPLAGAVVGAVGGIAVGVATSNNPNVIFASTAAGMAAGAAGGAAIAAGGALAVSAIGAAAVNLVSQIANNLANDRPWDCVHWKQVFGSAALGLAGGSLGLAVQGVAGSTAGQFAAGYAVGMSSLYIPASSGGYFGPPK